MLSLYRAFKRQLITFLLVTICNWFIQPCDSRRMIESSGPINLTDIDFANEQSDFHPKYSNIYFTYSGCDRIFISPTVNSTHGSMNGTFNGPTLRHYPPLREDNGNQSESESMTQSSSNQPYSRQCIYTFIAGENERVRLSFSKFSLRSESPDCRHEYIDIYSEIPSIEADLLETPFGGRYCDEIIPPDRISLYQILIVTFYTELPYTIGRERFQGHYEFINATPYIVGDPMPNEVCSFLIHSEQKREGEFMSPTYPGVYPKNMDCYYLFKGVTGQRVKLEFFDFDLYYGGPHCPLDNIRIYDGDSDRAPLINLYCGQQRQLVVFSSGTSLFVHFHTMNRMLDVTNRGFACLFEFSEKFVNLAFITNNENSEYMLGSECDQKILSRKESNGTIYAPNYPFLYHPNVQCKYFLYGLQDGQNLERINFQFEMIHIPSKDVNECSDASVRLYGHTFNVIDDFDYAFCGEIIPPPVISDGPILMVIFNSGSTQGQGFKAHYWFETDFKISGTQAVPGLCQFSYVSSGGDKSGEFNSPRHPSNYPSNTQCIYELIPEPDEQVMLVFNHFRFSDTEVANLGVPGYNEVCTRDWLEIFFIYENGKETFFGRFCAYTTPGPILSDRGVIRVRIVAQTDDTEVSSGFHCQYWFVKNKDAIKASNCGGNITSQSNGIITTPNYPNSYSGNMRQVCNWIITVKPKHRIVLHFDAFSVEGDPPSRGCSGAVVRVWTDPFSSKPIELCGDGLANASRMFLSKSNKLQLIFVTAMKSVGAAGFSAIWTEVLMPELIAEPPPSQMKNKTKGRCPNPMDPIKNAIDHTATNSQTKQSQLNPKQFHCERTEFCIAEHLLCNGIINCGFDDNSDESHCIVMAETDWIQMIGGPLGLLLMVILCCATIVFIGLCFCCRLNEPKMVSDDETNVSIKPRLNQGPERVYHLSNNRSVYPIISRSGSPSRRTEYQSELTGSTPTNQIFDLTHEKRLISSENRSKWSMLPSTSSEGANQLILDDDQTMCHHCPAHLSNDFVLPHDVPLPPLPPIFGYGIAGRRTMSSLSTYYPEQIGNTRKDACTSTSNDHHHSYGSYRTEGHNRKNRVALRDAIANRAQQSSFHTLPHRIQRGPFSISLDDESRELSDDMLIMKQLEHDSLAPNGNCVYDHDDDNTDSSSTLETKQLNRHNRKYIE